jgi:hypothetical protein
MIMPGVFGVTRMRTCPWRIRKSSPKRVSLLKSPQGWERLVMFADQPYRHDMVTILSAVISIFAFRFRSRASLELKLIALQHQLAVLRRQRPGRPQLSSLDRLLWVWLYRIWPQVIDAMILVKPATVVQWHRKGFRLHWRWRSRRPGRPKTGTEIRALIRRMSRVNPLWGAPPHPRGTAQAWHRSASITRPTSSSGGARVIRIIARTLKTFELVAPASFQAAGQWMKGSTASWRNMR